MAAGSVAGFYNFACFGVACVLIPLGITGCQTGENGVGGSLKAQGVYTTLAMSDFGLDLPASGYVQKGSFGPGESPAAVILGYGTYNQQQLVELELVESSTGRSLLSKDYRVTYGKAVIQPLAIRLSGDYKLRLTAGGTELDTFQFTVTRTNTSGNAQVENTKSGTKYAQGIFSVSIVGRRLPGFGKYDDKLIYSIVNCMSKAAGSTNRDLFAQRFPGKVIFQCRLDFAGRITQPKVLENTFDHECAEVFQKALLDRSPYDAWPEDLHQNLGSDYRDLTLRIYFD